MEMGIYCSKLPLIRLVINQESQFTQFKIIIYKIKKKIMAVLIMLAPQGLFKD